MSGSGPIRTSTSLIVGLLSLVVLGVVWGTVVLHLPKQDGPPVPAEPPPSTSEQSPAASPAPTAPLPPVVEQASPPRDVPIGDDSRLELPPIPAGVELKCQAEIEQLCPGEGPGSDRQRCLQTKKNSLTPMCRQMMQERMVRIREGLQRMKSACEADMRQFCRHVSPGSGRIAQCLEEHSQDVSESCYRTLPKRGALHMR